MFVAINNNEMNVPQVLDWINRTKNANNNVISPKFAMEILSKTNFYGHIKTVLKNIKENCKTKEDILPYKKFILSCVDRREMSDQAMADLQELVKLCGCEKEFDKANDKVKIYEVKDCENADVKIIKSKIEFFDLEEENLRVFFDADEVNLSYCDLSRAERIRFKEGAVVYLSGVQNLPKDLDVSMCSVVDLRGCDFRNKMIKLKGSAKIRLSNAHNLPGVLDFSQCDDVDLRRCNFSEVVEIRIKEGGNLDLSHNGLLPGFLDLSQCDNVNLSANRLKGQTIKFKDGAKVKLAHSKIYFNSLDLSQCSEVDLSYCEFNDVNEIKFREGAKVILDCVEKNIPANIDFSMCDEVDLRWCDLENVKSLRFRDGAKVDFKSTKNLPKDLDVSMCDEVSLCDCDLIRVEELKFKDRAKVNLSQAEYLGCNLDLSMCSEVNLFNCDLEDVKEIRFKNKEQMTEFMKGAYNFSGKVVYTEVGDEVCEVENVEENVCEVENVEEKCGLRARLKKLFDRGMN